MKKISTKWLIKQFLIVLLTTFLVDLICSYLGIYGYQPIKKDIFSHILIWSTVYCMLASIFKLYKNV
ncbi:hypothetical protein ACFIJ5_18185 (plasmid) [Haloimpatiens sp. FM7330]|uniref:hypothetical protein n=1 Tax=Haloimpatiens sp. FM7330 TaxID=3298610 RepID=UPI003630E2AF